MFNYKEEIIEEIEVILLNVCSYDEKDNYPLITR